MGNLDEFAWSEFLTHIEEMLDSREFDWAEDTLGGILDTVKHTQHVTPGQLEAVNNIARSRDWKEFE